MMHMTIQIEKSTTRWQATSTLCHETPCVKLDQHGPKKTPQDRGTYFPHRTKLRLLRHRSPASLHDDITTSNTEPQTSSVRIVP